MRACVWLGLLAALPGGRAEQTFSFPNPRLSAHLVAREGGTVVSTIDRGVIFAGRGTVTYRFTGPRLLLRGSALATGIEVSVSRDGEEFTPAGSFSGHEMIDVDLKPYAPVGFVRCAGTEGMLWHPPTEGQDGPFESEAIAIPAGLQKVVSAVWSAGEIRREPLAGTPDPYGTPQSVQARVVPGGRLSGGTYAYAIVTTFDEGDLKRNALQGRVSTGSGGLVKMTWPEMIGQVERLAKDAKKGKEDLAKTLSLSDDKEEKGEREPDGEDVGKELEGRESKPARTGQSPEYFFEVYRKDPGRKDYRLVHRVPKGQALEWVDTGTDTPGKALPPGTEFQPVNRRKYGQPYVLEPEIEAHFGTLPTAAYGYAVTAVLPSGEWPPSPALSVAASHATNEVIVEWDAVRGAIHYRVYRAGPDDAGKAMRFIAQVPAPLTTFTDHGTVSPGAGVEAALEVRAAPTREGLQAAPWRGFPKDGLLDLTGQSVMQFRASAKSDPPGYVPAQASVTLCEKGEPLRAPARRGDIACRYSDQLPWGEYRPLLGPAALPPRLPGGTYQLIFDGRQRVNCLAVAASAGLSCIRDYDAQYFSEAANEWQPLLGVRSNDSIVRLFYFDPIETRAVRFVTFGEPLFGAYSINSAFRDCAAGFVPVGLTAMTFNDQSLAPVSSPSYYDMWHAVHILRGRNRWYLTIRDLTGTGTTLALRARPRADKGDPPNLGERRNIAVAPGAEITTTLDFVTEQAPDWISLEIVDEAKNQPLYTFQYLTRLAPSLFLRLRRPDYRQTIFETQPDKSIEGEVLFGSSPDRLQGCRAKASVVRFGAAQATTHQEIPTVTESRWLARFDGTDLPYGSYTLVAELCDADGKVLEKSEQAFHRCAPSPYGERWIGEQGRLFVDGKPFIGLKMLGMGMHVDTGILDQAAKTGFNVLESDAEQAYARGGYVNPGAGLPQDRVGDGWFQRRVRKMNTTDPTLIGRLARFALNPSVLLYMYGDEIDILAEQKKDISAYVPGYNILKNVDPYHPALTLLFDSNGFLGSLGETADIFCVEPYLYANYSDNRRQVAARMKKIAIWTHAALLYSQRPSLASRRALWAYPMTWDPRAWERERDCRIPSVLENRCFLLHLLNEGTSGFLFYNYCTSYFHLKLNPLFWEGHRAAVQEVRFIMPYLVGERVVAPLTVDPDTASLSLGLYRRGDDYALIAANLDAYPVQTRIRLPAALTAKALNVLSEGRSVACQNGIIEDRFDGFGSHIYLTRAALPELPMTAILKDPRFVRGPHHDPPAGNVASETQGATAKANYTIWQYNSAEFAIDSDPETCWNTSAWATWGKKSGDWIEVAFRQPETIRRVLVRSWKPKYYHDFDDTDNLASDFDLQVWKEDWETVKEVRGNESEVIEIPLEPVTTPKVRVIVKKGLCVAEIEAYK